MSRPLQLRDHCLQKPLDCIAGGGVLTQGNRILNFQQ